MQWQDIRPSGIQFPTLYRGYLLNISLVSNVSPQLVLWLLMTGAISLFERSEEEVWLKEMLQEVVEKCEVNSWKQMHDILKPFLWIPILDNQRGKAIFDFFF